MKSRASHWDRIAQNWHWVGPPLRPCREDVAAFEHVLRERRGAPGGPARALILGVTPELVALDWPAGTSPMALDGSSRMIEALWKGPRGLAIVGSWTAAPVRDASVDIIACDGGFGMLRYPQGQSALLSEVRRMLVPGGIFAVRLFAPGCRAEKVEHIAADLDAGAIPSLDALKFRLWGALQADVAGGVRPREVVARIEAMAGSPERLVRRFGWPAGHVATLEFHRDSEAVYCLGDVDALRSLLSSLPGLEIVRVVTPDHPFGSRCPVVGLRRV